ncbi:SCO2583 family membrane protein [Streptomyces diastaticus]
MNRPGQPPDGPPDNPGDGPSGDDDYGYVFDDSFVRAAPIQEFSASERTATEHAPAVRDRPPPAAGRTGPRLTRQVLILAALLTVAFLVAVYLGVSPPGQTQAGPPPRPARMSLVPLVPPQAVRPTDPDRPFDATPAAQYATGAAGINLPGAHATAHFDEAQVIAALSTAKEYLVHSSLSPEVLAGREERSVRLLVDPAQADQFDAALRRPAADGLHAATGWLVRLDPRHAVLAGPDIRVQGVLEYTETGPGTLEVTTDHTFVYAVRPAADPGSDPSLLVVRRALRLSFDRDALRARQLELLSSRTQAGPLPCGEPAAAHLRPLLAGQKPPAGRPPATDSYAREGGGAVCGTLAEPRPLGNGGTGRRADASGVSPGDAGAVR